MGHIRTPGKPWEKGDILRDGKRPKNDLETTKAFSPQTTPIPILRKRKKKILIRAAWRGDPRREKAPSFPGKDEAPELRPIWRPHGFMDVGGLPRS